MITSIFIQIITNVFVGQPLASLDLLKVVMRENRLKGKSTWLLVLVRISTGED